MNKWPRTAAAAWMLSLAVAPALAEAPSTRMVLRKLAGLPPDIKR